MVLFIVTFTYCFDLDLHRNFVSKVAQCYWSQIEFSNICDDVITILIASSLDRI